MLIKTSLHLYSLLILTWFIRFHLPVQRWSSHFACPHSGAAAFYEGLYEAEVAGMVGQLEPSLVACVLDGCVRYSLGKRRTKPLHT